MVFSRLRRILRRLQDSDYLSTYRTSTDERVAQDPRAAIGGDWEEIGRLQRDFLVAQGLQSEHRMLDIGCGTLRGGRWVIPLLGPGNYTGIDLSPACIKAGETLISEDGLSEMRPRLLVSDGTLTFRQFEGETFDVLLAQSVFTHLLEEHIRECFENISRVMGPASTFYFTYHPSPTGAFLKRSFKDFSYPASFFYEVAAGRYLLTEHPEEHYPHPKGQRMLSVQLA